MTSLAPLELSDTHTGHLTVASGRGVPVESAVERVLKAVCQGYRTPEEIAKAADVSENTARTNLTRLRLAGRIEAVRTGRGKFKHYRMKDVGCLLESFWR